jgi:hypothetical protein
MTNVEDLVEAVRNYQRWEGYTGRKEQNAARVWRARMFELAKALDPEPPAEWVKVGNLEPGDHFRWRRCGHVHRVRTRLPAFMVECVDTVTSMARTLDARETVQRAHAPRIADAD